VTKYVIGATGALLGALAGVWLMLAPFALAYQGSGADWADPTYVDFWTGLPLLVVSLIGSILYVSGLVEELRRRGIMRRPYAAPAEQPQAQGSPQANASSPENNMEQVLLPLVTAMSRICRSATASATEPVNRVPTTCHSRRIPARKGA
jgi:hypothetical protein